MITYDSYPPILRRKKNMYSSDVKRRGLVCVATSLRLNANEGSA